jgi:proline iminopeptidase
MGQSWGGICSHGIRFEVPKKLKGLIISNMMAIPEYNALRKRRSGTSNGPKILKQLQDIEKNNDFVKSKI